MNRLLSAALVLLAAPAAFAQNVTRAEALRIGESFIHHRWTATAANLRHGRDASGIEIHTPDRAGGRSEPAREGWEVDAENIGVAYKWGGFDTPASFSAGVRKGRAAGDVYTAEKRRLGGAAVSGSAVGIDCSGFISRCWKLPRKHSTSMLARICRRLPSAADLQPADILNTREGHVYLFVRWADAARTRAICYEAAPFSKTRQSEQDLAALLARGYEPLRYPQIRD